MGCNIEIKARVVNPDELQARLETLTSSTPEVIDQSDSFYNCANGRLKLRRFAGGHGELIQYHRPDSEAPGASTYQLVPCDDPEALHSALAAAYGCRGWVNKRRLLFMIGQTRVHLDMVEGLGSFLELEVVLSPDQAQEEGVAVAESIMEQLGVERSHLIDKAYIDLLS
ncbi:MAG: class IV adenylate cyclase [bacterium]|nr:class IV adenylate cyclase [bacterium]